MSIGPKWLNIKYFVIWTTLDPHTFLPKTNIHPGNRKFQKSGQRHAKDRPHGRGYNTIKSTYILRQYQTDQAPKDSRRKPMDYSTKNTKKTLTAPEKMEEWPAQ
jgi:hypothetical protein